MLWDGANGAISLAECIAEHSWVLALGKLGCICLVFVTLCNSSHLCT